MLCSDVLLPLFVACVNLLNPVITLADLDVIIKELHKSLMGSEQFLVKAKKILGKKFSQTVFSLSWGTQTWWFSSQQPRALLTPKLFPLGCDRAQTVHSSPNLPFHTNWLRNLYQRHF